MPTLIIETNFNAPPEICFDLLRRASAETNKQTISGEFADGQTVTFQTSLFGIKQTLTVKVTKFERPNIFIDEMTAGSFKTFRHVHEFNSPQNDQTVLTDTFEWTSPFGIIGQIFDKLFIKTRLQKTAILRNRRLKEIAEIKQH